MPAESSILMDALKAGTNGSKRTPAASAKPGITAKKTRAAPKRKAG